MRYTYRAFLKKGIGLAPLEIEKGAGGLTYFCIDYDQVWERFHAEREKSLDYLKGALEL